jgi:RNA polymerase sigma-B factor
MVIGLKDKGETSHSKAKLVENYQYLVNKISEQFKDAPESRENLEEVGYIGLLNAANLYNESLHKIGFKTYAQILITEEMHQYLMNRNRRVDRPDWLIRLNQKVDEFVIHYREEHRRFPRVSEIASHLNINSFGLQEVLKARDSLRENYFSHDMDQNVDLAQIQPALEKIKSRSYRSFKLPIEDLIALRKALKRLKKLQEGIVYYLFIMDLSQTKLAKVMGLSPGKLNKMKEEAFQNLQ